MEDTTGGVEDAADLAGEVRCTAPSSSAVSSSQRLSTVQEEIVKVHVHRIILSRQSEFFKQLFLTSMTDEAASERTITVESTTEGRCLFEAMKVAYSQRFHIGEGVRGAVAILAAADKFGLTSVVDIIAKGISSSSVDAPLEIELCSDVFDLPDTCIERSPAFVGLRRVAGERLLAAFSDLRPICKSSLLTGYWKRLSPGAVLFLLHSEGISVPSENTVFFALRIWLRYSSASLEAKKELALTAIGSGGLRLRHLRPNFLLSVARFDSVFSSSLGPRVSLAYRREVEDTMAFHMANGLSILTRERMLGRGSETPGHRRRPGYVEEPHAVGVCSFPLETVHKDQAHIGAKSLFVDGWSFLLRLSRRRDAEGGPDKLSISTHLRLEDSPVCRTGCLAKATVEMVDVSTGEWVVLYSRLCCFQVKIRGECRGDSETIGRGGEHFVVETAPIRFKENEPGPQPHPLLVDGNRIKLRHEVSLCNEQRLRDIL